MKVRSNDVINVVSATDDFYVVPMGVMLYSLLANTDTERGINIYILDGGLHDFNRKRLSELVNSFKGATLSFPEINNDFLEGLSTTTGYITEVTYYRFAIHHLLDEDIHRVLYLDCDMVILDDIRDLWKTDIEGNTIGAIYDGEDATFERRWSRRVKQRLQMPPGSRYFNAGVLIIDLDRWREKRISQASLDFIHTYPERIIFDDQDGLNYVLHDDWFKIDIRWNIPSSFFSYDGTEHLKWVKKIIKNPAIVHYTSHDKPWQTGSEHPAGHYFWKYWKNLPMWNNFDLLSEVEKIRPGVSVITVCDEVKYLKLTLENWISKSWINQVVIVDISESNEIEDLISQQDSEKITLVEHRKSEPLHNPVALNIAVRAARHEVLLKLDPDFIVYEDFNEHHKIAQGCYFAMQSWHHWFSKEHYLAYVFYMRREDFCSANGYHEGILGVDSDFHLDFRLKKNKIERIPIDPNYLYSFNKDRTRTMDYDPVPEIPLPKGEVNQVIETAIAKAQFLEDHSPWNLCHQVARFDLMNGADNYYSVRLKKGSFFVHKVEYPTEELAKYVIHKVLPGHLRNRESFKQVLDNADLKDILPLKDVLHNPQTFLHYFNLMNVSEVFTESWHLWQRIDKIYKSYTWRIGSVITTPAYIFGKMIGSIKKRFLG